MLEELRWKMRSFGGKKGGKVKMCDKPISQALEEHKKRSESAKKMIRKRDKKGRFVKEEKLTVENSSLSNQKDKKQLRDKRGRFC